MVLIANVLCNVTNRYSRSAVDRTIAIIKELELCVIVNNKNLQRLLALLTKEALCFFKFRTPAVLQPAQLVQINQR